MPWIAQVNKVQSAIVADDVRPILHHLRIGGETAQLQVNLLPGYFGRGSDARKEDVVCVGGGDRSVRRG